MRDQNLLNAYTQYRLMPLPYRGYHNPHHESPVMCYVKWKNPFSTEHIDLEHGLRFQERTFLTFKMWCVCTTPSCWGPGTYRHFSLDEFSDRTHKDQEFAAFMGLLIEPS